MTGKNCRPSTLSVLGILLDSDDPRYAKTKIRLENANEMLQIAISQMQKWESMISRHIIEGGPGKFVVPFLALLTVEG